MPHPAMGKRRDDVDHRNVFRDSAYRRRVKQVAHSIQYGRSSFREFLMDRTPEEVGAGLQYYLLRLPKPLIPKYMQNLALDATCDIQPEVVAADILGLIQQDISERHLLLITILLDLLLFLKKHDSNDELTGSCVPVTLLPVFFTLQPQHLQRWRFIANIFMEMVDLSPAFLPLRRRHSCLDRGPYSSERDIHQTNLITEENHFIENEEIFLREENVVLRQVLVRNGCEGDANFAEIVNIGRLRQEAHPKMLNRVFGYFRRKVR